jgi:two-component system sensor histidine kinase UhpB
VRLRLGQRTPDGGEAAWPDADNDLAMPRGLVLALYRMSQEALTNVARHARAQNAELRLVLQREDIRLRLDWVVCDDGIGLAHAEQAQQRGNGLAGLKERAWAQGSDLQWAPVHPGSARPGLMLTASFDWTVDAAAGGHEQETAG